MPDSPATQFTDVVVTDDQTRRHWRAGQASIRDGLVVVAAPPPPGFFDAPSHTYTITARDRGDRTRRFASLSLARREPQEVAFR